MEQIVHKTNHDLTVYSQFVKKCYKNVIKLIISAMLIEKLKTGQLLYDNQTYQLEMKILFFKLLFIYFLEKNIIYTPLK